MHIICKSAICERKMTMSSSHTKYLLVSLLLTVAFNHSLQAEQVPSIWPQFRGPNAQGSADGQKPPTILDPNANVVWKTPLDGAASSPCIWNDRIFITTFSETHSESATVCLDRATGEIIWKNTIPYERTQRMHLGWNTPASGTPATDGQSVFVYIGNLGLISYDFDGKEVWRKSLPIPITKYGPGTSPVLIGGNLILNLEEHGPNSCILGVDPGNGKTAWEFDRSGLHASFSTPLAVRNNGEDFLVHAGCLEVSALNPRTGELLWRAEGLGYFDNGPSPIAGEGLIYVVSNSVAPKEWLDEFLAWKDKDNDGVISAEEAPSQEFMVTCDYDRDGAVTRQEYERHLDLRSKASFGLLALSSDRTDGGSLSPVVWTIPEQFSQVSTPLCYRGNLYLVNNPGSISCYDAKTGEPIYADQKLGASGRYLSSPVAANGAVYFCSHKGVVTVIRAGSRFEVISQTALGEDTYASPAIADSNIYIRTLDHLWAFGE